MRLPIVIFCLFLPFWVADTVSAKGIGVTEKTPIIAAKDNRKAPKKGLRKKQKISTSGVSLEGRVGASFSQFFSKPELSVSSEYSPKRKFGVFAAVGSKWMLSHSIIAPFIFAEAAYVNKGDEYSLNSFRVTQSLHAVEFPFGVGVFFEGNHARPFLEGGMSGGFIFSATRSVEINDSETSADAKAGFKPRFFSALIGGGAVVPLGTRSGSFYLPIHGRYLFGLTDVDSVAGSEIKTSEIRLSSGVGLRL